jgi:predicted ribosome quality control (RQC) complex YloA/Tae2 family protein
MGSRGRPYRTVVLEGYEVLIGKGDEENDQLTFDVAAPADFWLHVAGGTPGSHVVIRNPEKLEALPPLVVARAARLAAWYSKSRRRRQVDVHLCQVADVRKRRGAPAGEVELRRWQRIRVRPVRIDEAGEG